MSGSHLLVAALLAAVWFGCGVAAALMDIDAHPKPVIRGVDEAFRCLMVFAGPAALAAVLFMQSPRK
jgi:hypothetical protein